MSAAPTFEAADFAGTAGRSARRRRHHRGVRPVDADPPAPPPPPPDVQPPPLREPIPYRVEPGQADQAAKRLAANAARRRLFLQD